MPNFQVYRQWKATGTGAVLLPLLLLNATLVCGVCPRRRRAALRSSAAGSAGARPRAPDHCRPDRHALQSEPAATAVELAAMALGYELRTHLWSSDFGAPKGRPIIAWGNAPGTMATRDPSPVGALYTCGDETVRAPLQGSCFFASTKPRAMPLWGVLTVENPRPRPLNKRHWA